MTEEFFKQLELLRVYTRNETGVVSEKPIVLSKNSTVQTIAEILGKNYI